MTGHVQVVRNVPVALSVPVVHSVHVQSAVSDATGLVPRFKNDGAHLRVLLARASPPAGPGFAPARVVRVRVVQLPPVTVTYLEAPTGASLMTEQEPL